MKSMATQLCAACPAGSAASCCMQVLPRDSTPWHKQFRVLLRRSLKEVWRKRNTTLMLLFLTVIMAVLVGECVVEKQGLAVRALPSAVG